MTAPVVFQTPGLFDYAQQGLKTGAGLAHTAAETGYMQQHGAYMQQRAALEQAQQQMEMAKMQAMQEHSARMQQMGNDYVKDLTGATDDNTRADVTLRHAGKFASIGESGVAEGLITRSKQFADNWNASATKKAISDVLAKYTPEQMADAKTRIGIYKELAPISQNAATDFAHAFPPDKNNWTIYDNGTDAYLVNHETSEIKKTGIPGKPPQAQTSLQAQTRRDVATALLSSYNRLEALEKANPDAWRVGFGGASAGGAVGKLKGLMGYAQQKALLEQQQVYQREADNFTHLYARGFLNYAPRAGQIYQSMRDGNFAPAGSGDESNKGARASRAEIAAIAKRIIGGGEMGDISHLPGAKEAMLEHAAGTQHEGSAADEGDEQWVKP